MTLLHGIIIYNNWFRYPKCDKSTFVGCGWTIVDTKTKEPMAKCVSGCPNTIEWDNDLASL